MLGIVPLAWCDVFPFLEERLVYLFFVDDLKDDMSYWKHSTNGILDSKEAFHFISRQTPSLPYGLLPSGVS